MTDVTPQRPGASAGWFNFTIDLSIGIGAIVGFLVANLLISAYGGRATR